MSKVAYIWSKALQDAADQLPSNLGRSSIVHGLIGSLDLLDRDAPGPFASSSQGVDVGQRRASPIAPDQALASPDQLRRYHTTAYVDYLLSDHSDEADKPADRNGPGASESDTASESDKSDISRPRKRMKTERHGFEHDCPAFPLLPVYAVQISSGTLTACRMLARGETDIAINWDGGRHHAMRNRASGFCYVADVVLGIVLLNKEGKIRRSLKLSDRQSGEEVQAKPRIRVMYIDFDLHYGDGVAAAFHSPATYPISGKLPRPPQVLTLSIHHSAPAFFPPPTPFSFLPKADTTSPFSLSIPLLAYPSSRTYRAIWPSIERVYRAYRPDYIILQLGADGLPGDPIGQWGNWTSHGEGGMIWAAERIKEWGVPLCILGGGGYNSADTARAWAGVTAAMLDRKVQDNDEVPHHVHFPAYAPSFTMGVAGGRVKDENSSVLVNEIESRYQAIADRIRAIIDAHAS